MNLLAMQALSDLEYKRHRAWSLGPESNVRAVGGTFLTLLAAGLWVALGDGQHTHPTLLIVLSLAVYIYAVGILSGIGFMTATTSNEREWWVLIPHSRLTLVLGRAWTYVRLSVRVAFLLGFAVLVDYVISWSLLGETPLPSGPLLQLVLAVCLTAIVATPVAVAFGMLGMAFATGYFRIGLILIFVGPSALVGLLIGLGHLFSATAITALLLKSCLWVLGLGWPLTLLAAWLAAHGVNRLGNTSLRETGGAVAPPPDRFSDHTAGTRRLRDGSKSAGAQPLPWLALWQLELSRFRWLSLRAVPAERLTAWGVLMTLMIGGFLAGFSPSAVSMVPAEWLLMSSIVIGIVSYTLPSKDVRTGYGLWWLAMPFTRKKLLSARVAALLTAGFALIGLGDIVLGLGIGIHNLMFPIDPRAIHMSLVYLVRAIVLVTVLTPVQVLLFQGLPALMEGYQALFSVPIYLIGINATNYIGNHWIVGSSLSSGPKPNFWPHILLIALVGLPLAMWGFRAGSQNLHMYLQRRWDQRAKS